MLEDVYINSCHTSDWHVICAFGTRVERPYFIRCAVRGMVAMGTATLHVVCAYF